MSACTTAGSVGTITYAHVNPAFDASYRGGINRWGGLVGTVGQYTNNSCWQVTKTTGHHVHIELSNEKLEEHGLLSAWRRPERFLASQRLHRLLGRCVRDQPQTGLPDVSVGEVLSQRTEPIGSRHIAT